MTDEFAPPPPPPGTPAAAAKRADFRQATPASRRRRFPRWVAVLLAVGGLVIVGSVAAQILLTSRDANLEHASADTTGKLHSAQLVVGMCIEELGDAAAAVNVVPCEEPHSAEVATALTLSGDEFPGSDAVATKVLDYCASQLAPGGPLADAAAGREWLAWVPSQRTWRAGDRSGLCIVTSTTPWSGPSPSQEGHAEA